MLRLLESKIRGKINIREGLSIDRTLFSGMAVALLATVIWFAIPYDVMAKEIILGYKETISASELNGDGYNVNLGDVLNIQGSSATKPLTIILDEDLTVSAITDKQGVGRALTIQAEGDYNYKLTVTDTISGVKPLEIKGGTISANKIDAWGNINISGGTVNTSVLSANLGGHNITISGDNTKVVVTGKDENAEDAAILAESLTINGGTVNASMAGNGKYVIRADYQFQSISISGAKTVVTAKGGKGIAYKGAIGLSAGLSIVKPVGHTTKATTDDYKVICNSDGTVATDIEIRNPDSPVETEYTITVNKGEGGKSAKATFDGETVTKSVAGKMITISAEANSNYVFDKWEVSEDIELSKGASVADNSFRMPAKNVTLTARFKEKGAKDPEEEFEIHLSVDPEGTGTVTSSHDKAKKGTPVTITAKANEGYHFIGWEENPYFDDLTKAEKTFGMPEEEVYLTAFFEADDDNNKSDDKKKDDGKKDDGKKDDKIRNKYINYCGDGSDESGSKETDTPPAKTNPLALILVKTSGLPYGTYAARAQQGPAATAAFKASVTGGFVEGFSFNLITNGTTETTLKSGSFTLLIPADLQKPGRTFEIHAVDKSGKVIVLPDLDNDPATITVAFNLEGFAFDLLYKD